ncbi:MAG: hypothetical protein K5867_11310 [Bacteroidales bacterium]|nr:hypothetical protein [Bacteroidales bacterium]
MKEEEIARLMGRVAERHGEDCRFVASLGERDCDGLEGVCRRYRRRREVRRYLLLVPLVAALSAVSYAATPTARSHSMVTDGEPASVCVTIDNIIG